MNMSAFAPARRAVTTPPVASSAAGDQRDSAVLGSPTAQSTFSLAMIREAFKGLLVTAEMPSSSSAEQRGVLEHSIEQGRPLDGKSAAFDEEKYSFKSVLESEQYEAISSPRRFRESYVAPKIISNVQIDTISDCSTTGESR